MKAPSTAMIDMRKQNFAELRLQKNITSTIKEKYKDLCSV